MNGCSEMDFETFRRGLELFEAEAEKLFPGFYLHSRNGTFYAEEAAECLTDSYLDEVLPWTRLDDTDTEKLRLFAARLRNHRAETRLFIHAFRILFESEFPEIMGEWPEFTAAFGDDDSLFYLLLSCAVFLPTLENYRRRGIPDEYAKKIGVKISSTNWLNRQAFGKPGYKKSVIRWLRQYADLKVIPVGRFEFRHGSAEKYNICVFRNRDGKVLALYGRFPCGFSADGECCPADDPEAVSRSGLVEDADFVIGQAADPVCGRSLGIVKLDKREWRSVISPQSPILEWHIPGGGGMTPEVSRDSLTSGFEFFDRYFPELPAARAIMCSSWAFWHRYEELRPLANPSLVMRECYEFGRPMRGWNGFYFLFGADTPDELPHPPQRDTSIRRAMLDIRERDGYLGTGGIFILREDLSLWGSAPYRTKLRVDDLERLRITAEAAHR